MRTSKIGTQELSFLKRLKEYQLAKLYESNEGHNNMIERRWSYNLTPSEMLAETEAFTSSDVLRFANEYLPRDREGLYTLFIRNPLQKEELIRK